MRNPQFVRKNGARLGVRKTYKLFIGGKFVRSESGRVLPARGNNGEPIANYGRALRRSGAVNMKRYVRRDIKPTEWRKSELENPYWILDTLEMKTAWHPIGL